MRGFQRLNSSGSVSIIRGGLTFPRFALLFSAVLWISSPSLRAAQNHWTGAGGDNLWTNALNWSLGVEPDSTHDVFIEQTGTNGVILNYHFPFSVVRSLTLGDTQGVARLDIPLDSYLTCQTTSVIRAGSTLNLGGAILGGNWTVDGTANLTNQGAWGDTIDISSQGTVNLSGNNHIGAVMRNRGIVSCSAASTLWSDGQVINSNRFILHGDVHITWNGFQPPQFFNFGTIELPDDSGLVRLLLNCALTNRGTIFVGTNSTLEVRTDSGSVATFQDGTVFSGAGVARIILEPIYWDGTIVVSNTVEYLFAMEPNGTQSRWTGPGLFRWLSGRLSDVTFAPGFQVEMVGDSSIIVPGNSMIFSGNCTNLATIRWQSTWPLLFDPGGSFNNSSMLILETNCGMRLNIGDPLGAFHNQGTILVPADHGDLTLNFYSGGFTNRGSIQIETNSTLQLTLDNLCSASFENGTAIYGPGAFIVPDTLPANWTGACTNYGVVRWAGGNLSSGAVFNNFGRFILTGDAAWAPAFAFVNQSSGSLEQSVGTFSLGKLTNSGVVKFASGALNISSNFVSAAASGYQLTLGSTSAFTGYHRLTGGTLGLNGPLTVTLTNGFIPANSNSFTFVTNIGVLSGKFSSSNLPALPVNLSWRLRYFTHSVVLSVVPSVRLTSPIYYKTGAFQSTLTGPAGSAYTIEASTNLVNWTTLKTNSPFTGSVLFSDTNALKFNRRFYRGRVFE